jgi:tetratricopeptide (TPR) repeat protein
MPDPGIEGVAMTARHLSRTNLLLGAVVLGLACGGGYYTYRSTRLDYRLQRCQEALERGDWNEAERMAVRLENGGHEDHAHLVRGKIYYGQAQPFVQAGQPQRAGPLLERALREFNQIRDQGEILLEAAGPIGVCLLHLQSPAEAERTFQFVVKHRPDHLDAHRGLAAIYYDHGAPQYALFHCQEWARLDPEDGRPHRFMGQIYLDLEEYPEAVVHFRAALERRLGPRFVQDVRENLAAALVKQAKHSEALEVLEGEPAPVESPQGLALRGESLLGLKRTEDARRLLDQALAAHPAVPELLRLRAQLHLQEQEWEAAVPLLQRAVGVDRHDPVNCELLAQAYERLGRHAEAAEQKRRGQEIRDALQEIERLSREAKREPRDASLCQRLAELYDRFDQPQVAAWWRRAAAWTQAQKPAANPPAGPGRSP